MENKKFTVQGMSCAACSAQVEKTVSGLEGVSECNVNLLTGTMEVKFDDKTDASKIIDAVEHAGYSAMTEDKTEASEMPKDNNSEVNHVKKRLIVSAVFAIPLFYIAMLPMVGAPVPRFLSSQMPLVLAFVQFLLLLPIVFVNMEIFANGFKSIVHKSPNMNSLIAVGSGASIVYGLLSMFRIMLSYEAGNPNLASHFVHSLYFDSASMILTLVTLGKFFEAKAKRKTSNAITKLINLSPKNATVLRDNTPMTIPVDDILKNDIVVIKPGETIPVDGIVVSGSSELDVSAITGESIPVAVNEGTKVVSGSINLNGAFQFRAEKVGAETTLAKIIKLVEDASSTKAPIARLADRISNYFVPIVIAIAVVTFLAWFFVGAEFAFALTNAIAVLVISCPCALGLATPTAIMVGMGKGASLGILIKSAEALETLHKVKAVVFDKTGTITEGKLAVENIKIENKNYSETEFLQLASSVESFSEHPIATAIVNYAKSKNITVLPMTDFNAVTGRGIYGTVHSENSRFNNQKVLAGNKNFMLENNIALPDSTTDIEETATVFLALEKEFIGAVFTSDTIKEDSIIAMQHLKDAGVKTYMLTGDNKKTAKKIAEEVKIDEFIAELLPNEKQEKLAEIKKENGLVAFVGDGINDSPSLVSADVGIALGAGTDIAIESADVVLINNNLYDVVNTISLSKQTMRVIKQNLFWALFYNALGIPLAAGVFYTLLKWQLNPMFAAAAMSLSSVTVTLNALRLRFFSPLKHQRKQNNTTKNTIKEEVIKMAKTEFKVEGMSCGHCSARVEKALSEIQGVTAKVNLETKTVSVEHPDNVTLETLKEAVKVAGYEPQ